MLYGVEAKDKEYCSYWIEEKEISRKIRNVYEWEFGSILKMKIWGISKIVKFFRGISHVFTTLCNAI